MKVTFGFRGRVVTEDLYSEEFEEFLKVILVDLESRALDNPGKSYSLYGYKREDGSIGVYPLSMTFYGKLLWQMKYDYVENKENELRYFCDRIKESVIFVQFKIKTSFEEE